MTEPSATVILNLSVELDWSQRDLNPNPPRLAPGLPPTSLCLVLLLLIYPLLEPLQILWQLPYRLLRDGIHIVRLVLGGVLLPCCSREGFLKGILELVGLLPNGLLGDGAGPVDTPLWVLVLLPLRCERHV